ncbi:TPA: hypothetical protein KE579_004885 [Citrobacter braakii]|nr:hypothetical protein [Citrobacter braakii]
MKNIALFIAAVISAPALAWTNGDVSKNVDFAGTITPEQYTQLWEWKVGTGLNDFRHNITDMNQELKKLTIPVDQPKLLLTGRTKQTLGGVSPGMGAIPNIALSDFEKNKIQLQDGGSPDVVYFELPVKDENNHKLGTLKVNAKVAAYSVGPDQYNTKLTATTTHIATADNHAFWGGLKTSNATGHGQTGALLVERLGGEPRNNLAAQVKQFPYLPEPLTGQFVSNTVPKPLLFQQETNSTKHGIASASYVMAIDSNQTMEVTFDTPVTATTKWSAPLNVAVTYN